MNNIFSLLKLIKEKRLMGRKFGGKGPWNFYIFLFGVSRS